jgi:predicted GIY-YIG superfamily endonuclease
MKKKWTEEKVREEALKYTTRISFQKGSGGAYNTSRRKGILDDICSHMIRQTKWTYETLKEESLKYNTKSSFINQNASAYSTAYNIGILDDICSHMVKIGNLYSRFIYTIEFENNSVYVGLTNDLDRRKLEHIKKSSNKYVNEFMSNYIKFKFNSDKILYNAVEAVEIESLLIIEYKKRGYNVLNISKGGELGNKNGDKWTYDMLKIEALKYKTRSGFRIGNNKAYQKSIKMSILDDICLHMISPNIKWTYDMLKIEALKYKTRNGFRIGNNKAYSIAHKRRLLDDICKHMIKR